jgi:hypothetical protein
MMHTMVRDGVTAVLLLLCLCACVNVCVGGHDPRMCLDVHVCCEGHALAA